MTNIALVVLDTLRKDVFDDYFGWLPGRRFERAYSTSHRTVPAHASLFTGQYASEIGVGGQQERLVFDGPVLAEQLRDAGYTTRAFSANPYISEQFGYDRGFEEFGGSWRLQSFDPEIFDWGVFIANSRDEGLSRYLRALWACISSDCDTLRSLEHGATLKRYDTNFSPFDIDDGAMAALETVRNSSFGDDEFLFVNLMEAHAPYNPPGEYQTTEEPEFDGMRATVSENTDIDTDRLTDIDTDRLRRSYRDSVRYLSDVYRDIFAELRRDFDYVITLSDHGELFGEHGAWNHCYGVFPELTHVPLVVSTDEEERIRDETVVSLLDVHQTILDSAGSAGGASSAGGAGTAGSAGTAGTAGESRGQNLLENPESTPVFAEYRGLTPRQLDRLADEGIPRETLESYDEPLDAIAAPSDYYGYETRDGYVETGEATIQNPRQRLTERRAELARPETMTRDEDLSESVLEQLDQLGYT